MALPSWLRQQDEMDAQREQFPANDSYYGERRELAGYGGLQQGAEAQPVTQNQGNPMIEDSRTAVMNSPAPVQAAASPAPPYEEAGRGWPNRPAERVMQRPEQRGWPDRPAERDMQRPEQRGWPNRPDQRQMPRQTQRGWGNRPAERQPAWGRSQQQPTSQGNTASPAQPAQRDAAAYGQPKKWGA